MTLAEISTEFVFQIFLIFLRVGFCIGSLPVIGERYIISRLRIFLAFFICIVIHPVIMKHLPKIPLNAFILLKYAIFESIIGFMLGFMCKIYFLSLDVVGNFIGMQSGLSAANFFDPNHHNQVNIFTTFLTLVAIMTVLASDSHHVFIIGLVDSYEKFNANQSIEIADIAKFFTNLVTNSFILSFKISAPFLVSNIAIQLGSGILSRLMPNLQVFFIIVPIQILVTFAILSLSLSEMMNVLIEHMVKIY